MSPTEFTKAVASIDLSRMPWNLRVFADYDHARMRGILGVSIRSPHRDTGKRTQFAAALELSHEKVRKMKPPQLLRKARAMCRHALLHELDENFRVNGTLPFDPHAKEQR